MKITTSATLANSPIFDIDFYKAGHIYQYPENTEKIQSNLTPRSGRLFKGSKFYDDKVVVVGLQMFLKEYLQSAWQEGFFDLPWSDIEVAYKEVMDESLGKDSIGTEHIRSLHTLGFLPISISAIPEGERVPFRVPVLTIENTLTEFSWLVNYLESVMSSELWLPMTSATIALEYKRILMDAAERTGCPGEGVAIQAHDFSFRGMEGRQAAVRSSVGHLTSFIGTDCVPVIPKIKHYYGMSEENQMPIAVSVPATEHSVMCMGTQGDELETFRRLIEDIYPSGIVSIVSDTWDFWKVITEYLPLLEDKILARDRNALGLSKVVIRPDSGDPVDIICGTVEVEDLSYISDFNHFNRSASESLSDIVQSETPHGEMGLQEATGYFKYSDGLVYRVIISCGWGRYDKQYYYLDEVDLITSEEAVLTPEQKGAVECLWETFGGTTTSTGHRLLEEHIGLIYGDSITLDRCHEICDRLSKKGFASQNVVFGVGSFTYQFNTRDTLGFAVKATWGVVNGEEREIFKDPKTDTGAKKSAKGYLSVGKDAGGDFYLVEGKTNATFINQLQQTFYNGHIMRHQTFDDVRNRLNASL